MDPRAKRIAMAIYNAQSPQLAGPQRPDRLQLPSSTNLPNISIPDMAVGSTMSKKAHAIKALPQFSVVKDKSGIQAGQADITGLQQGGTAPQQQQPAKAPSVTMPGDVKLEPQVSSEKMSELTNRVLGVQTRILQLRNDGADVKEAEEKLIMANQYFGQMNMSALETTLNEMDAIFGKLEKEKKVGSPAVKAIPDMKIESPPVAPAQQPQPPASEAVSAAPAAPSAPPVEPSPEAAAPPGPPEAPPTEVSPSSPPESTPPPDDKKDVFSDLQKMLDGMK